MSRYALDYASDRKLFRTAGQAVPYLILVAALLAAPFLMSAFFTGEVSFVLIMCIASLGLMVLTGFSGQVSLGHGAFLAIGGYTHALLLTNGCPLLISLGAGGAAASLAGVIVGIPAIRVSGLHLAMVTLAFAIIVEHTLGQWSGLTGGHGGLAVPEPEMFGFSLGGPRAFYFFCLVVLAATLLGLLNLLRSPIGRAWIGVRDSEAAALGLGINVPRYKLSAFVVSAAVCGLGGGLLAHQTQFITPEAFGLPLSLQLMMMVFVGGIGSLRGAVLGAVLIAALPTAISTFKVFLPVAVQDRFGLVPLLYGLVLAFFVVVEPKGLDGRWSSIRAFLRTFPLDQRRQAVRQKVYMKSERYR
jgi:branched-chain amino acid transport system permease protein